MSTKISLILLILSIPAFSQQIDFHSPKNIKLFADFLFCDKDYLRAADEYDKYLKIIEDDTAQFKIALAYSNLNNQSMALNKFSLIRETSKFYEVSKIEKLKSLFLTNSDSIFFDLADSIINSQSKYSINVNKFKNTSLLLIKSVLLEKENFLIAFDDQEKKVLSKFYDLKMNPPYKSELLSGIFSAIVPGAGKIYTENYSDGITAFILTGLLSYLAYTNFEHDHPTRGWIFASLGAGFYAGNIYGSIASAQIFNAKVSFDFKEGVNLFLEENNYYLPVYDFCK